MTDARHDEFVALTAAYALGALDAAERVRFEAHLRTCDACQKDVDAYRRLTAGVGGSVDAVPPPPALKARVLAAATSNARVPSLERPPSTDGLTAPAPRAATTFPWLALAASLVLAAAAGAYAWILHTQVETARQFAAQSSARAETMRTQLSAARGEAARAGRLLDLLTAPDVVRVNLTGTKAGSTAKGQAYWSPSRGVWFTADGLPVLLPGRIYQLWLVLPKQSPVSAGLLTVDARGAGTLLAASPLPAGASKAGGVTVAITDEPTSGSPAPTTPILLAGGAKPE